MTPRPNAEQLAFIQGMATGNTPPRRSPVLKTPTDYGMKYEDVFFSAIDGVPLEAWFIPADSNRLVVLQPPPDDEPLRLPRALGAVV